MKCGFESVFGRRSEKCELEKRVLGEMRGGKEGKEGEKQDGGMREFYGPQKVGLQHTEKDIFCGVVMSFQLMVRADWLLFKDSVFFSGS